MKINKQNEFNNSNSDNLAQNNNLFPNQINAKTPLFKEKSTKEINEIRIRNPEKMSISFLQIIHIQDNENKDSFVQDKLNDTTFIDLNNNNNLDNDNDNDKENQLIKSVEYISEEDNVIKSKKQIMRKTSGLSIRNKNKYFGLNETRKIKLVKQNINSIANKRSNKNTINKNRKKSQEYISTNTLLNDITEDSQINLNIKNIVKGKDKEIKANFACKNISIRSKSNPKDK